MTGPKGPWFEPMPSDHCLALMSKGDNQEFINSVLSINQRTNGPVNAHLRPEIYTCTNKLVRLEWDNT